MINILFLMTVAGKPTFVAFLWHSQTYVRGLPMTHAILSNFFEERCT